MRLLLCSTMLLLTVSGCASGPRFSGARDPSRRGPATPEVVPTRLSVEPVWEVIGSYSTRFHLEVVDRVHNIRMAAAQLDGAILGPSGRWSFNEQVGRRSLRTGWRLAPALVLEGARPAVGGGICQASSTVYNAALLADLRVRQRHPHTRPVRYVPLGRDATVSWGSKDLQLSNPHPFPIRFEARVLHDRLTVRVLAPRTLDYEVRLETADAEPATPRKEIQVLAESERLAVGGVWVKLYRLRVRDGSVYQSERVGRSSFYPFRIEPEVR